MELVCGGVKRDRPVASVGSGLVQSPLDLHAAGFGPLEGGSTVGGSGAGPGSCVETLSIATGVVQPAHLFRASKSGLETLGDHPPFRLRQGRVDMERKFVTVSAEGGHHEVHLMLHQRGDEVNVARQAIQARDDQGALPVARVVQGRRESGALQKGIPSRTGVDILMPGDGCQAFVGGEGFAVGPPNLSRCDPVRGC
jgi:hypothetical protein